MNNRGNDGIELWNEEDGFFYDVLHLPDGTRYPLKVRSMVGLIPLFAVETLEPETLQTTARFQARGWSGSSTIGLTSPATWRRCGRAGARSAGCCRSSAPISCAQCCGSMLDEREFLSPYGIRALSRVHKEHPYVLHVNGEEHRVDYEPAESSTGLFGGNSNWRGPIWFPVNFLLIESLQKFHHYFGDDFKVECPTGSGQMMTLWQVAAELSRRLSQHLPARRRWPAAGLRRVSIASSTIRTGAIWSCSTSTSTATTGRPSARAIRPDGRASSRSCCSRAASRRRRRCGSTAAWWLRLRKLCGQYARGGAARPVTTPETDIHPACTEGRRSPLPASGRHQRYLNSGAGWCEAP